MSNNKNILIVGASQGIGLGFVENLLTQDKLLTYQKPDFFKKSGLLTQANTNKIYATYRSENSAVNLINLHNNFASQLTCLQLDVTEENQIINVVKQISSEVDKLHLVINCVGILHEDNLQPEKSLKHINSENLLRYFEVNSIASVLLAKHLKSLLKHQQQSVFAAISAKVGSISDNQLGGWYGYRASKAALNMFMKTVAIEYSRTNPNTIVITLHPGTTNTHLSLPFQKNVPPEKLFSVNLCVNQLLNVINNLTIKDTGQFFSWDGSILPY